LGFLAGNRVKCSSREKFCFEFFSTHNTMEVGVEEFAVPPHDNVMARLALLREEQAKLRQVFRICFYTAWCPCICV